METLQLLSSLGGAGESSATSGLLSLFGLSASLYSSVVVFIYLLAIVTVCLVLYYFTGNDKKADKFFPNLMGQSLRVFSYVWMFLSSIAFFAGLTMVFFWMFDNVLPDSKGILASGKDAEWDILVKGLLIMAFALILIGVKFMINRMVVKTSGIGGTVSTKIFVSLGLVLFSILMFVSGLSFLLNFVDYLKESKAGLDPMTWSIFFSSFLLLSAYMAKAWMVLKEEK